MKIFLAGLYTLVIAYLFTICISIQAQDISNPNDLIPELIGEINLWRLSLGLEPLVYNQTLEQMAISQVDFLLSLPSMPNDIHIICRRKN